MTSIPFGCPIIGAEERKAVADVLDGPILVHGPRATKFEEDFAAFVGAPHAVSVSSCTAGMHLVWFALGLGPEDEVICPAQTHAATAHAVALTGAKPVFVDAEPTTGNIDLDAIDTAITPHTKAIAIVHYLGMPVDMIRVMEIARRHKLFVLEDCALACGTYLDGTHAGLLGDVGVFSFYPVKHMTTAEGGMIITRSKQLAEKLKLVKAFGVDRTHGERKVPGMYDVVALGFNYRMSEIHAAIGIEQVKKLGDFLRRRRTNYDTLSNCLEGLNGVSVLQVGGGGRFTASLYCLQAMLSPELAAVRPEIMAHMAAAGVGSSVYYPQPVPRMSYYREKFGYDERRYTNAAAISDRSIALSVGPHLDIEAMKRIAHALKTAVTEVK